MDLALCSKFTGNGNYTSAVVSSGLTSIFISSSLVADGRRHFLARLVLGTLRAERWSVDYDLSKKNQQLIILRLQWCLCSRYYMDTCIYKMQGTTSIDHIQRWLPRRHTSTAEDQHPCFLLVEVVVNSDAAAALCCLPSIQPNRHKGIHMRRNNGGISGSRHCGGPGYGQGRLFSWLS